MKISKLGAWSLGSAVLCVLLLVAVWFLLVSPQRAEAAELRAQTETVRQQNSELQQRVAELRVDFANLATRRAELEAIRQALPTRPSLAAVLDEIDEAGAAAPLTLVSVVAAESTALLAPVVPEETVESPEGESGTGDAEAPAGGEAAGDEASAGDTPAPDPAAPDAGAGQQGAPGEPVLAAIPITITTTGDYFGTAAFLKTIQTDISRALIVDAVSVDVAADDGESAAGQVTTTVTARVFVYVDPEAVDSPTPTLATSAADTGETS